MEILDCPLDGAKLIQLTPFRDDRGAFARIYCEREFERAGLGMRFCQANMSVNPHAFTMRGLHMQSEPYGEDKLVVCVAGAVFDVIVDLRPDSPTRGRWFGAELSADNGKGLLVPKGFAHGFLTLQPDSTVIYQVSQFYTAGAERGFRWNDPGFAIEWPTQPVVVSDKDKSWPDFA